MPPVDTLEHMGQQALQSNDFEKAAACYEQLLEQQPDGSHRRLPLGLAYLLMGQEEAAQLTWAFAFSELASSEDETGDESRLLEELIQLVQTKIQSLEQQEEWHLVDLLYLHLQGLCPLSVHQILQGIQAALNGELLNRERLENSGLLEALAETSPSFESKDLEQLDTVLQKIVLWDDGEQGILDWIEAAAHSLPNRTAIAYQLHRKSIQIRLRSLQNQNVSKALAYVGAGLRLDPDNFGLKHEQIFIHNKQGQYEKAVGMAEALVAECRTNQERIFTKCTLLDALIHLPDRWGNAQQQLEDILQLLRELIEEYNDHPDRFFPSALAIRSLFFYQYIKDNPVECRELQNALSNVYVNSLPHQEQEEAASTVAHRGAIAHAQPLETPAKLRVGFLSECMTKHSVGWLSRWIFQHFDRDRFEFYTYFQTCATNPTKLADFSYNWFAKPATKACITYGEAEDIAQIIKEDNLNILVDLDSLTSERNYSILALKPAPIQVTWLGYDATGLPTVDYFLADRFVVPDHADDYYTETIWRLPSTYIAVDGFEVDVPTLRRDQLNIPEDAVIYFSAQNAAKRHPDTVHCQIQILKQVPNSYLLLKGVGSEQSLRNSFLQAAAKEGIEGDRFRFLGSVKQEATHRANLGIADVVLDTFPYTGATTTLETLWMGIPLVTRIGQQFTSRNSYALLRHAGIEAGLAHSADEYIEWGIRFGTDAALRNQVKHQLWRSRQTSPLWNAKQFTRDLEHAFEQMWQRYLQHSGQFF